MVRRIGLIALVMILALSGAAGAVSAATSCTVKYYFTSERNPESVPSDSHGFQSGSKWKIKPSGPSRMVYTKNKNGRTMMYTFDGWYTNINCMGTKYLPGRETTAIAPVSSSGRHTVCLYGRWIYSEDSTQMKNTAVQKNTVAPVKKEESNVANKKPSAAYEVAVSEEKKNGDSAVKPEEARDGIRKNAAEEDAAVEQVIICKMGSKSREEALAEWKHLLIDTFFHVNDRKYSFAAPGKYWKDRNGAWSGRTGRNGSTQSCITLPSVSLKRTGIIPTSGGNIWLSSNMASTPNRTVKKLKKQSTMLTIFYPHKSLKHMAAKGIVKYGDILCRSGHTFVFMGRDSEGHPLIFESGTHRDIGNGTAVTWGHHSGGHANKLTGKINRQIQNSNAIGDEWRKGQISDAAFKGHRASGKNLNKPIHIVCSINTFTVKTSCTNGNITPGDIYMAGKNVNISYSPSEGGELESVKVDGKDVDTTKYGSAFSFARIGADHQINVIYKVSHEKE